PSDLTRLHPFWFDVLSRTRTRRRAGETSVRQSSRSRQCTLHHVGWLHSGQRISRENGRQGIHSDGSICRPRAASGIGVRASHCEHSTTTVPLRRGAAENNACLPSPCGG